MTSDRLTCLFVSSEGCYRGPTPLCLKGQISRRAAKGAEVQALKRLVGEIGQDIACVEAIRKWTERCEKMWHSIGSCRAVPCRHVSRALDLAPSLLLMSPSVHHNTPGV